MGGKPRAQPELSSQQLFALIKSDADWVLAAIAAARAGYALTPADMIEWIDWRNHVRFSPAEIDAFLAAHEAAGRVRRTPAGWLLAAPWP